MLYIITEEYFLSDYILEALKDRKDIRLIGCETVKPHGFKRLPWLALRYFRSSLFNKKGFYSTGVFSSKFLKEVKNIRTEDKVLLFSFQNLKNLMILDKELGNCKKSLYLWNPLQSINHSKRQEDKYANAIHKSDIHSYTFDSRDAIRYGFELIPQVYRKPDIKIQNESKLVSAESSYDYDLFFVGIDKNRREKLSKIINIAKAENLSYRLHIVKDKQSKNISEDLAKFYKTENLLYPDYLKGLLQSRAILEILQPNQTGMTVRTLEALFMGRKLITDNADAKHFPFYHSDNIYILGSGDNRSLREFHDTPFQSMPPETLSPFEITTWINRFV